MWLNGLERRCLAGRLAKSCVHVLGRILGCGKCRKNVALRLLFVHASAARIVGAGVQVSFYVIGKEQMKIRARTNIFRRLLLASFLWIRENSRTKMADMNIPVDNLLEVGFIKEI